MHLPETRLIVATGGIGWGVVFELVGNETLGRNESRAARLRESRDYAKMHIVLHYCSALLNGAGRPRVRLVAIGKVGDDPPAARLLSEMAAAGIDLACVDRVPDAPTLFAACFIYPDSDGGNITAVNGASQLVSPADVERAEGIMAAARGRGIAVALPEVPLESRRRLLQVATHHGFFRIASFTRDEARGLRADPLLGAIDLLALNLEEAAALAGTGETVEPTLSRCAALVTARNPQIRVCVTAGGQGSWGFAGGAWEYIPAVPLTPVATAGAGDAYLAGVIAGLVAGLPFIQLPPRARRHLAEDTIRTACDYGAVVAGMSVTGPHTIHPEIDARRVARWAAERGLRLAPQLEEMASAGAAPERP